MRSSLHEYVNGFFIHLLQFMVPSTLCVVSYVPSQLASSRSPPGYSHGLPSVGIQVTDLAMFLPHAYMQSPTSQDRSAYVNSPQGKVAELRLELNSGTKKDKNHIAKKIALKKIVANMTMSNNDMVALFPDVVNCMRIQSLEVKKMWVHYWYGRTESNGKLIRR
jgi:hypothetical protein